MALFLPTFGFGSLFYASILSLNAVCVLSEDRFLARIGMGNAASGGVVDPGFGQHADTSSTKAKLVSLMNSIRTVARIPLVFLNILVIIYLLILG